MGKILYVILLVLKLYIILLMFKVNLTVSEQFNQSGAILQDKKIDFLPLGSLSRIIYHQKQCRYSDERCYQS